MTNSARKKQWLALVLIGILLIPAAFLAHGRLTVPRYVDVLVLMYHDIQVEPVVDDAWTISQDVFRYQMETLQREGFTVVSFDDLIAFVDHGRRLPERPVVITFDDGYQSNLDLAAPILEELGMTALISVVGTRVGTSTYRDTDIQAIPAFPFEAVMPWVERGVIQIGHHSYDMHMVELFETPETFRHGVLQREGESMEDYFAAFYHDFHTLRIQIEEALGTEVLVYVYPYGHYNEYTEAMLREWGVRVTLSTRFGSNVIERGNPDSLFGLARPNMYEELVGERLVERLNYWNR